MQPSQRKAEQTTSSPFEVLSEHPLTPSTQRERRSLLAISSVSILLVWTGVFPNELPALGMSFRLEHPMVIRALGWHRTTFGACISRCIIW